MYEKIDRQCPICLKSDEVVAVTYKGCDEEIFIECERCWTVIGEMGK